MGEDGVAVAAARDGPRGVFSFRRHQAAKTITRRKAPPTQRDGSPRGVPRQELHRDRGRWAGRSAAARTYLGEVGQHKLNVGCGVGGLDRCRDFGLVIAFVDNPRYVDLGQGRDKRHGRGRGG